MWGAGTTVKYTASSASAVSTTGTAPTGSSASLSTTGNWNSPWIQCTNGKGATLTLSGYKGYKITAITIYVKSNSSKGTGSFSVTAGSTSIASISESAFNTANWNSNWNTSGVTKSLTMTNDSYEIKKDENVTFTLNCKSGSSNYNSLYIQYWEITYEAASSGCSNTPTMSFSPNSVVKTEGDEKFTKTVSITGKGTGQTVAYSSSNTSVATVDASTGEVTIKTNGSATITASVAESGDYCSASATYTLTVNKPSYTVNWYVGGTQVKTESVTKDEKATLPSTPDDDALGGSCSSLKFMGWSETNIGSTGTTAPLDLFTEAPTITSAKNYYAVFAESSIAFEDDMNISGTNAVSSRSGWASFSSAYGNNGCIRLSTGSATGSMRTNALTDLTSATTQISFKIKAWSGTENGQVTLSASKGTIETTSFTATSTSFEEVSTTITGGDNTTTITFTGTSGNRINIKDITIGEVSNYVTSCCTKLGSINGSVSLTQSGNDLVVDGWTATTGSNETGYFVQLYNSDKSSVLNSGNTVGTAKTYTFTNPGAGTYWVSVTPTYSGAGNYCATGDETFSASSITLTGKVVVTFKLNGGTVEGDAEKTQEVTASTNTPLTTIATLGYVAPSCKEFGGWAASEEDANAATPVVFKADGATINVSGATNLWAIWNTKSFAVTDGTIDATSVASHSYSPNGTISCGGTLTITCAATNAYKGNPTVTATGTHGAITVVSETEVTIANVQSAIAVSIAYETAKASYDITWKVGGQAYTPHDTDPTKQNGTVTLLEGDNLVLPTAPAGLDCAATFVGWSTDEIGMTALDKDDDATRIAALGLFKDAAHAPAISTNTTFHAVFATFVSAGSTSLTKMVTGDTFADGDRVVITADGLSYGLLQETVSSSYVNYWTFEGDDPALADLDDEKKIWDVTVDENNEKKWILGDGTNGYLYNGTGSSNNAMSVSETGSSWALTDKEDDTFSLRATNTLSCRSDLTGDNQYKWRGGGQTGTSGTSALVIYKLTSTPDVYNNYVTKCCKTWSDPTVTYNTYALVAGGDHATVTITGDQKGLTPTYSSSNTNVITVDAATGEVTPVGAGSATVTVTWTAANDYCEKVIPSSAFTVTGVAVITFKLNGGSVAGDVEKTQNVTTGADATLTSFATLGYVAPSCKEFGGWAASEADANAATPVVFKTDGATINVSGATNLWAIWNTKSFAVTDGTIDEASVASHSYSANPITCGSDLTITCAATNAYKGEPTVTATGTHGAITVVSETEVTIANVQSAIAVSIAYETAKASYDITWKVGGQAYTPHDTDPTKQNGTATLLEGDNLVLPSAPADNKLGCANTFMGWSTHDYKSVKKAASDYSDLFTAASGAPEITEATTFYAVFATQSGTPVADHDGPSWERSGTDNTVTSGYTFSATASAKTDYYQDASSGTGELKLYHTSTPIFSSKPSSVTLTASIGAGNDDTDFDNYVYARLLDQSGNGIGNAIQVTNHITNKAGDTYTPTFDLTNITSAYGVMLYHEKESSKNVRYFSFGLSYTTGGTTTSDYVTECAAVEAPTFTPAAGTYNEAQSVELSCATENATIRYTTDGSIPSKTSGTVYNNTAITIDQNMTLKAIAYKGDDVSDVADAAYVLQVATPEISGSTNFVNSATITIEAAGADNIYYTTNGVDPTTESTPYSVPFTVDADGTTTVKAIAVKANWTNSAVASQAFTKITPMTVAAARTAIDAGGDLTNKFVKGIISQIDSYNSTYNSIQYWISDDGTTTDQLEVYGGLAGVVKAAFESVDDLKLGEEVIVNGTLKKFNSTYEFDKNNTIVAIRHHSPIAWSAGACTVELNGEENEYPTLSGTAGLTISYESTTPATATINENGVVTPVAVGSTTIKATSAANDNYVATTVSYTLTVSPTVTKVDLDIECNGATSGCPETTHLVKQTNLPDPLPAVAKAGKNFGGWYTDNTFETPAVAGASISVNTTIYAQWLEPYTVAEALTIISGLGANNANTTSTEYYYVAGVVTDDAVSVSSNTATYFIKDAGVENELKVYKGKGLNNVNVTDASQIQEGDEVVVYGQLQNYFGTGEVAQGNYIYSQNRPTYDVESVSLPSTANVRAGKTITLTAEITPSNATNKNVTWSVKSGDTYAEVSAAGVVTGKAAGTAVIEVETEDGGFKAQCTVTVAAGLPTFEEDDHEWIKVSNASKLVAGRFYVIGVGSKNVTATNELSGGYLDKVATTITDGVIESGTLGTNTAIFELGGNSTSGWTLYELTDEENTGYLSGTTNQNLAWSENSVVTPISFDEDGNAVLGEANGYRILYNNSSPRFKPYTSATSASMLLPQLYMWAELSHAVTFDANGGVAESVPGVERTDEGKIIIPATEPTHSDVDKAFAGWYKSDAPSTLYTAGDEFSTNVDVTLYAKWNTVPTYTVTYVPGGEGTVPAVASYRAGQKVLVEEAELSNAGYSFAGWTVKDADQNVLPIDEENKFEMPASNVTITAVWSRISSQKWNLVKYGEALEIDAEYVIAYNSTNTKKALSSINTSGSTHYGNSVEVTIDGEVLKGSELMKALTLKAGNGGSNYAFKNGDNYLIWNSGNSLDESATLNDASSWTIAIDENDVATITNVGTTSRMLQFNSSNSRFACYQTSSKQQNARLYKKAASVVINNKQTVNAEDIPANADVTVKNGGTLNVNAAKSVGDLTVENGGKVVLDENKLTVVGTFIIESTMASGNSGQLTGATASNFAVNGAAYIDITLGASGRADHWHAFTVPFPVDVINGVYDLNNNKLNNEEHYAIMEYHGDVRATGAYGWKKIRTTLVPGTFYLMTVDGERTTYRFKKKAGEALVAENSKTIYEYAKSGDGQNTDAGWNGVGNPTLRYGKVDAEVQVLDPETYTYKKKDANSTNFVVGTPFFYQAEEAGSMVMETADASANYAPRRTPAKGIEKIKVSFGNEEFTDYLDITANEEALNEYQIGKDLVKMTMTNTPKVAQIFGKAYNTKLCMINTPLVNNRAEVALELYAPADGEYTISAEEREDATVYLLHEGHMIWNLSAGSYVAELQKGNNTSYSIRVVKAPKVTTDIEEVMGGQSSDVQKVIIDDQVFILRGGKMFDVTGKMAK